MAGTVQVVVGVEAVVVVVVVVVVVGVVTTVGGVLVTGGSLPGISMTSLGSPPACAASLQRSSTILNTFAASRSPPSGVKCTPSPARTSTFSPSGSTIDEVYSPSPSAKIGYESTNVVR